MRKILALAGVVVALALAAPVAAQADSHRHIERTGPRGGHYEKNIYRQQHQNRGQRYRYDRRHDYRHMQRRSFTYWRPHLERYHYRSFGHPVFYNHYYRVRARDFYGRFVILTVNAYTGVVISSSYY